MGNPTHFSLFHLHDPEGCEDYCVVDNTANGER